MEIVRPGTGDPVTEGDVGEIVVHLARPAASLDPPRARRSHRRASGPKPVRAHQHAHQGLDGAAPTRPPRSRACFVRPEQIAEIGKRHPELGRLRLVVTRSGEADLMTLKAEAASPGEALQNELATTLRSVTKLGGNVELVAASSLPNDGKVISDER